MIAPRGPSLHLRHWPCVGNPRWPCEIKLIGKLARVSALSGYSFVSPLFVERRFTEYIV